MPPSEAPSTWTRIKRAALAFDSWLNASAYEGGQRMAAGWERLSEAMGKLRVRGPARVVLDLSSEAMTLGLGGAVVMLALALPAFRETSDNWLKTQELAVTFLDRYGQEVGRRGIRHDDSVKLDEMPDYLIKAAIATEDRRFFEHWGIDPIGTLRAVTVNARSSGVVQGGSTITQQLAKNLFLSNERSIERKIKEAFLAVWLEFHLSKAEILKLYFDRAYMGGGTFGVAAAADYYFGKSVKNISLSEAAMMAGLFKAPTKYAPHVNLPAARARANDVLANMVEAGYLTDGQIQTARRNPASPVDRKRETTPDFYLDWAFDEVKHLVDAGKLGSDRVLTVKTALDVGLEKHSEQVIEDTLRQHGSQYEVEQAAMVVLEPDGALRGMVGGRDYGQSQFNRATDALRQPGSSFKPFVYATALATGRWNPASVVVDAPICLGNWCPANYGKSFSGPVSLTSALARSINSIPVRLSLEIGRGNAKAGRAQIIETAKKMGLTTDLKDSTSLPIGSAEVTVIDMASAYAVFANGGRRAKPYAASEIRNSQGEVIYRHDRDEKEPGQVLSPRVVADMNLMMSKVPEEGTGKKAALEGIKSAGKTGTTNDYHDAWYVGFTGNLVAAVWFGNDDNSPANNMTGGSLPAAAWHDVMTFAHQNMEIKPIPGLPVSGPAAAAVASAGRAPATSQGGVIASNAPAPGILSRRSFEVIGGLGELLRAAGKPAELKPAEAKPAAPSSDAAAASSASSTASAGFSSPARAAENTRFSGMRSVGGRLAMP